MQAWVIDKFNGIENIRVTDVDIPIPGNREVLLKLDLAALNPADRYLALGQYPARPPLPHILGRDGCGTVEEIGEGVDQRLRGVKMCILRGDVGVTRAGTFAEYVVVPVDNLLEVPAGWTLEEASCATLVYLTAYQALTMWEGLPAGANILISGASGGVGTAAIQLASALGYRVAALSRSDAKRQQLSAIGADVYDAEDGDWPVKLRASFGRIDLAIDNIGGTQFTQIVDTLGDNGRVSCVGRLAGLVPEFNTATLFFRRIRIGGVSVGAYRNEESRSAWLEITRLLKQTSAKPLIDSVFPFDALPEAFRKLAEGPLGKVLVRIKGD